MPLHPEHLARIDLREGRIPLLELDDLEKLIEEPGIDPSRVVDLPEGRRPRSASVRSRRFVRPLSRPGGRIPIRPGTHKRL